MDVVAPERLDLLGAIDIGELLCAAEQHRDKGQAEEQQQAPPAAFRRQVPPCAAKHPGDAGYSKSHQQDFRAIVEKPRQPGVERVGYHPFMRGGIEPQALGRHIPIGIGFHQRHQHEEQRPKGKLGGDHAFRHVPRTSSDRAIRLIYGVIVTISWRCAKGEAERTGKAGKQDAYRPLSAEGAAGG